MNTYELQELEVATDNFSPSRIVGKGSHGCVYRGVLKDGRPVAIKKQSSELPKLQDNTKLANEARILSTLHPNSYILNLLGISQDTFGNKIIVTEYMQNGTLHEILHVSTTPPPWQKRVEMALQIAKGLCFLHELNPSIVHRDIKSANILFDNNWDARVADFGLAVRLNDELNLPAGTMGYIDPNYTTPSKLSTKIDVFSYGVVLLELISGRKPIDVIRSPASIVEWAVPLIEHGQVMDVCDGRVPLPRYMGGTIKKLLRLATHCLSLKESIRPSMSEIVTDIENAIEQPIRYDHISINFIRHIIVDILRRRKSKFDGTNGVNAQQDGGSSLGNNKVCNGTLPVREILADLTLK
ncbi:Serine/threonine protein kinase [Handroanthus impetiginosus]|uniref:Serine/threonine protein kinase n=1 Tax=Handroanthus impetiginosus TaxID=429701 RepID=A0A2G9IB16_9LAMI|nr:Serine/threonine protein kinase [Handroanthus impetiginosus]